MRTRYDQFGKQMVKAALAGRGPVETDAEVSFEPRRIDLWFNPHPASVPQGAELGLLGRMTETACTMEFFHRTPSAGDVDGCVIKHGVFRHWLSVSKETPAVPTQWIISSGRPSSGIEGMRFHRGDAWPDGFYEGPPLLRTFIVAVSELEETRATLLLRLLGAGGVLKRAIAELSALSEDAPERTLALPILVRLRLEVSTTAAPTADDQEFLMDTQDIVEKWRNEAIQEGVQHGVQQGVQQGLGRTVVRVYEARFGVLPAEVRKIVGATHDERLLDAWIVLASTGTAEELVAAVRATR